ncbi:hypothetical protein [Herbaspirillum sp. LeCh32-8]|nr:hypothetical protein [Herbaspirillum sp. LeCh32-8]
MPLAMRGARRLSTPRRDKAPGWHALCKSLKAGADIQAAAFIPLD